MKKLLVGILTAGLMTSSSFAITKDEAVKKIKHYISGMKAVSNQITVCEDKKYYIGEVYNKGYEGFDVVRIIFVNKKTGDLLPAFAERKAYCYMHSR